MILVTGATGRTSGEVLKALLAMGEQVRALVRDPQTAGAIQGPGVELVVGDLEKPETWDAASQGVEKVFLLSPEGPQMAELHGKFADAAKRAGVRHLVRMSMLVSNPDSPLVIAKWHGEADQSVANSGIPYTIIRPAPFMQIILGSAPMIASDGMFSGAQGEGKVGVIDTRDIGNVVATVLTSDGHEGKTYPLTGPEALSMGEMAGKLSAVCVHRKSALVSSVCRFEEGANFSLLYEACIFEAHGHEDGVSVVEFGKIHVCRCVASHLECSWRRHRGGRYRNVRGLPDVRFTLFHTRAEQVCGTIRYGLGPLGGRHDKGGSAVAWHHRLQQLQRPVDIS